MLKRTVMNKLRRILIIMSLLPLLAQAQNTTTPYSMYGYGILRDRATSMQRQMGGVGYAMNSGRQINVMNPASYAQMDSLTFLFDLGADVSILKSKEDNVRRSTVGGGVDYLTMQVPITKFMGASFGMVPYSSVGYAFGNDIHNGTMENQGTGGITELYLGLGGKFKGIALGANISYNFGTIVNDVFSQPVTGGQTKFEHVMRVRDWNINIGAQYTATWNRFNKLVVGATFSPKKSLHGRTWATIQETVQDSRPDTIGWMGLKDNYFTPMSVGGGISYTFEKAYKLMVEADVTFQKWSDAKYSPMYGNTPQTSGDLIFKGMKFNDRKRYAAGAEFVPKVRGNYLERVNYRLGAYYCDDYLNINGNSVKEMGVSCGFGLPAPEGKTMINLGFEYKRRYASPQKLISEDYFNICLGVNFNEVWFWKRKIK